MKAVVITKFGEPDVLKLEEIDEPKPSPADVLVKVHATALNRADLLQRRGQYPPPPGTREDIPGLEFAGEVEVVADRVTKFKAGDRVMGLLSGEGYAEKIVTPEQLAFPIPANLNFEEAACIPEVFLTAYDALFSQLELKAGERLLIHAVGSGVGIAALQLAKNSGAIVFGTAGSEKKLKKAHNLGLDSGINYKRQDFREVVLAETDGEGVHAIVDMIGAAYWHKNMACLSSKGRMMILGLMGGSNVEVNLGTILKKRLRIMGSVLRARPLEEKSALTKAFVKNCLPLFESGELKPIIDCTFPIEEAAQAHAYMEENKNFGKIVLKIC